LQIFNGRKKVGERKVIISVDLRQTLKDRFRTIEMHLAKESWFRKDGWMVSTYCFPNDAKAAGVTFHVFKKHWWNDDHRGIHIESYLDLDEKKQKKTYITLHLLHSPTIPGTKIKRIALSKPFVDQIENRVKKWPGYKFRVGKYGQQPFTKFLDGTAATFEEELGKEVMRICKELGPTLESCLRNLDGAKN